MTRHRELLESPLLAERAAIFTDAERVIADPIVRNRGTIGGALCQADPSEDLSAVCSAIGAQTVIRGLDGDRVLDIDDFHRGPYQTAVEDDEMLLEIRVPLRARCGSAYEKVDRRVGDWAVAAAGASLTLDRRARSTRPAWPWPPSAPTSPAPRPATSSSARAPLRTSWSAPARPRPPRAPPSLTSAARPSTSATSPGF